MIANHIMISNRDHYNDFVADAITSESRYDADTEAPSDED